MYPHSRLSVGSQPSATGSPFAPFVLLASNALSLVLILAHSLSFTLTLAHMYSHSCLSVGSQPSGTRSPFAHLVMFVCEAFSLVLIVTHSLSFTLTLVHMYSHSRLSVGSEPSATRSPFAPFCVVCFRGLLACSHFHSLALIHSHSLSRSLTCILTRVSALALSHQPLARHSLLLCCLFQRPSRLFSFYSLALIHLHARSHVSSLAS